MIVAATNFDWDLVWKYHDRLLNGLWIGVEVALVSLVLSVLVGVLFAMWRMVGGPIAWPAALYINIFRGMPALMSVIWVYFGLALALGVKLSVFTSCVIALVLLYSAYLAEVFRAALTAIARGQREAGLALGMTRLRLFFAVVLPQAARIAIPNVGSALIGMVKDTSTFMVIGLAELVYVSQAIVATTFQPFVLYTAAAALYVVAAFVIDFLARMLERSIGGMPTGTLPRLLSSRRRKRIEGYANVEVPGERDGVLVANP